jgi:hypothetical protein
VPSAAVRLGHWLGLVLAGVVAAAAAVGLAWWLEGDFPATVESGDVTLVLAGMAALAALLYGFCRAAASLVARLVTKPD